MIKYLRKFSKHQNLVIACNKSEKMLDESQYMQELARMGVEENFFCSALTGEGVF
jgi:predicted GTPase